MVVLNRKHNFTLIKNFGIKKLTCNVDTVLRKPLSLTSRTVSPMDKTRVAFGKDMIM